MEKVVVVLYPDARSMGSQFGLRIRGQVELGHLEEKFKTVTTKLLDRYRRKGHLILGVMHKDTLPNEFSPLFCQKSFDCFLSLPDPVERWDRVNHRKNLEHIFEPVQFPRDSRFIVGGFHSSGCVKDLVDILRKSGYQTGVDLRLTDALGPLLISHYIRNACGRMHTIEDRRWDRLIWNEQYRYFEEC